MKSPKTASRAIFVRICPLLSGGWAYVFGTDPEATKMQIEVERRDFDVGWDGRHWFHLFVDPCLSGLPKIRMK
jgi:hypothetical protein